MELTLSQEAHDFAYRCGLRELAPLMQRLLNAESAVAALTARVEKLETDVKKQAPPHLHDVEKR